MGNINRFIVRQMDATRYLASHPGLYSPYDEAMIKQLLYRGATDSNIKNDIIRELLDELGMIPDEKNLYLQFIEIIKELYPNFRNMNIVEVGGGILPRLGERLSLQMEKGKVTVYDPLVSKYKEETDKLKIKRTKFTRSTPVDGVDLIVALKPCKGAEAVVDNVRDHGTDFVLGLCEGGPHGEGYDYFEWDDEWIHSTITVAERAVEEQNMGTLEQRFLDKPYYEYPIIYNKRKSNIHIVK